MNLFNPATFVQTCFKLETNIVSHILFEGMYNPATFVCLSLSSQDLDFQRHISWGFLCFVVVFSSVK
jgi:hypothetical protein